MSRWKLEILKLDGKVRKQLDQVPEQQNGQDGAGCRPRQPIDLWLELRQAVRPSTRWLNEVELMRRSPVLNPFELVDWHTLEFVFTVDLGDGVGLYPAYIFDPKRDYQPYPVVRLILQRLHSRKGSLGVAAWFASANPHLGNRRPLELIAQAPDQVLTASRQVFRAFESTRLSLEEYAFYKAAGYDVRHEKF